MEKFFKKFKEIFNIGICQQLKENSYIPEVMKLTEQYPYSYQNVYYIWLDNNKDIKRTEKELQNIRLKGW